MGVDSKGGKHSGLLTAMDDRPGRAPERVRKRDEAQVIPEQAFHAQGMRALAVRVWTVGFGWASTTGDDSNLARGSGIIIIIIRRRDGLVMVMLPFPPRWERLPHILAFHHVGADAFPGIGAYRSLVDEMELHIGWLLPSCLAPL